MLAMFNVLHVYNFTTLGNTMRAVHNTLCVLILYIFDIPPLCERVSLLNIYIYMFMVWCDLHWLDFVRHALENAGLSDCTSYGDSANSTQTNVRVQSRKFPSGKGAKSRGNKWTSLRKRVNEEKQTDKNYWAHLTGYDKRRILYDERL